jgi:co-chaperonin GroES (HSP10)
MNTKELNINNAVNGSLKQENIDITFLGGDRLILDIIDVKPISASDIIDPSTLQPYKEKDSFDRWPYRAKVTFIGINAYEKLPDLKVGDFVFLEDFRAGTPILINKKKYLMTRTSNILLSYVEK